MNASLRALTDANEAVADVAYRLSETIAIYPITPSSPMAEFCDEWATRRRENLFQAVPEVTQLQSEGGVAGAVHGALTGGSLATTFTASQGLLLMIPNLYKIAGELTPFVLHVTARSIATHALSIFGDHSDVMACRQVGFAMVASRSVQEAQDLAAISHATTLLARVPFLHFFDGFRTSHEINTYETLSDEVLKELVSEEAIREFRARGLTPDAPALRGTAQNPDVFFQGREAANPFYDKLSKLFRGVCTKFAELTGRTFAPFRYEGDPEAEEVVLAMGSGAETAARTAEYLNANEGRKVGVLTVHLYRPFLAADFLETLPVTTRRIAVLDRTKEPGAFGEPLFLDVLGALAESGGTRFPTLPQVIGGRYGLGSKEFTPAMAKAVFDELATDEPRKRFSVGVEDDVTGSSIPVGGPLDIEGAGVFRALFYGLGSDGTVGANKNSIKIIGESTGQFAQAYFVYDSKKSGAVTVSHLRFGQKPIQAAYVVDRAQFIGIHQFPFLNQLDCLKEAAPEATILINTPYGPQLLWDELPREVQETIRAKKLTVYGINAYEIARASGMRNRINTIMQTAFFAISGVLPQEEAIRAIKVAIEKTYRKKGEAVVTQNHAAVDASVDGIFQLEVPAETTAKKSRALPVSPEAPQFVRDVIGEILAGRGDDLPVSALPCDGTWPTATSQWEKRNIAQEIPVWNPSVCIQCNKCALVCPHATIRAKYYPEESLNGAPETFQSVPFRARDLPGQRFTIQVAPEDCTGCALCVAVCPAKDKSNPRRKAINMEAQAPLRDAEAENYDFFLSLPEPDRATLGEEVKATQFRQPLFEYSGACAGCGETPYIKLLTQLFGDRLVIANATGCSSIYGGNLPTTPYATNAEGRGPAWSNSLFEDNAEFGFGMRCAMDRKAEIARSALRRLAGRLGDDFVQEILDAPQGTDAEVAAQRERVVALREKLGSHNGEAEVVTLRDMADHLVDKMVWILGGDGWAYDIGYGGLDHVLASGRNVKILVMDTEVYSNTGGQMSKATPLGAVAKFAAGGKGRPKKDLGLLAMSYQNVYVAQIAMGAKDSQTVQAFLEAARYPGPALIIAYSHCIAHGYNLSYGMEHQKLAVQTGHWPLYRFDPRRRDNEENPLRMDSPAPKKRMTEYLQNEARFKMLELQNPERAQELAEAAEAHAHEHYAFYANLARDLTQDNPST